MNMVNLKFTTVLATVADPEFPGVGAKPRSFFGKFCRKRDEKEGNWTGNVGRGPTLRSATGLSFTA